ncbi:MULTISPECIES: beta-ketoacyl synthase N-terminal-like domain-containing protein [Sandaracinus]|uniref:beta-ketoacyl synthase N-terminal-like domain-containing protein n=1 Tax=Sandaracinus TaxID=1055688 RepID=UPI0019D471EA|nr:MULTISPECIES: beta-ketoacyl synthase N-terminal-like domain-containing protein [Sandaracinus]QRN75753.1 Polyketide synthase [Sandaracinus sp.]UJR87253.1 Hypothetical protein I5071_450 [Sandaracinus amylolyticus]
MSDSRDIAIVGASGRFPGAPDLDAFASLLARGEVRADDVTTRWERGGPEGRAALLEAIDRFDHAFFHMSPREARAMDPQQRILLEEAWRCVESAGLAPNELARARTAVIVGVMALDHLQRAAALEGDAVEAWTCLGNYAGILANRISYALGLDGESKAVDAACASSLVALHDARRALLAGECEFALVGAANVICDPLKHTSFGKARMLSPRGVCRPFDVEADGYVPGEGVAVLLLCRLEHAAARGLHVMGVLKGSAVGHVGHATSITAPRAEAQADVVRRALRDARVAPATIGYVEAHATGTSLGDPIELEGLRRVFEDEPASIAVGSIKANLGHLEAAAGLAGVLKVLAMMRLRRIVPTPAVTSVNPILPLDGGPLRLATHDEAWTSASGVPRRAGVSSFGFGGACAHVVLEEAPPTQRGDARERDALANGPLPFVLSARSSSSLRAAIEQWSARAPTAEDALDERATLLLGRQHFAVRFVCDDPSPIALRDALHDALARPIVAPDGSPRILLHLGDPGSGSGAAGPWWRALSSCARGCPSLASSFERVRSAIHARLGARTCERWDDGAAAADELRAMSVAVAITWGRALAGTIELDAVAGSGAGRLAAWVVAGSLDDVDAIDVAIGACDACKVTWRAPGGVVADLGGATLRVPGMLEGAYLVELARAVVVDADDEAQMFAEARELAPRQHTFRKYLEEWAPALAQVGLSIERALRERIEDASGRALVNVALVASLRRLYAKWSLSGRVRARGALDELAWLAASFDVTPLEVACALRDGEVVIAPGRVVRADPSRHPALIASDRARFARDRVAHAAGVFAVDPLVDPRALLGDRAIAIHVGPETAPSAIAIAPPGHDATKALAALFGAGASIDWRAWIRADQVRRVPLPTYRFDLHRAWLQMPNHDPRHPIEPSPSTAPDAARANVTAADERRTTPPSARVRLAPITRAPERSVSVRDESRSVAAPPEHAISARSTVEDESLSRMLRSWLAAELLVDERELDPRRPFAELGVDSVIAVEIARRVRAQWDVDLPATALYDHPTLDALRAAIASRLAARGEDARPAAPAPTTAPRREIERAEAPRAPQSLAPSAPPHATDERITVDRDAVAKGLRDVIAAELLLDPAALDRRRPFAELGVDSVVAVEIARRVRERWSIDLPATALYDHPTLEALTRTVAARVAERGPTEPPRAAGASATPPPSEPTVHDASRARVAAPSRALDIAIVGMAGRFPGADDVDALWRLLSEGRSAIAEVPPERWAASVHHDPDPRSPGKTVGKWGGFLRDVDQFDPAFFGVSPAEAEVMDPQHRLFLEACWHALEDAAIAPRRLAGSRCGVFAGVMSADYDEVIARAGGAGELEAQALVGGSPAMLAARVAYLLDLRGPTLSLDTACSSSLVAMHLAARALRSGEADVALAGGVTLYLTETPYVRMSKAGMLSPSGRCRPFDDGADGMVPGEAAVAVVLKRLDDALRDGDRVHGVIRATGINQDGRSNGITAPSTDAQRRLLEETYGAHDIDPSAITLVEAHGTGTTLGDPIELAALREVFARAPRTQACALGSLKGNLGHTSAAAGAASLVKVLLCMRHGELVPAPGFERWNRHVQDGGRPFYVPVARERWVGTRRATVSSFGFGGTNAHLVVDAPSPREGGAVASDRDGGGPSLLLLSARTESALRADAAALASWLRGPGAAASMREVEHTLARREGGFARRVARIVRDRDDAIRALEGVARGEAGPGDGSAGERTLAALAASFVRGDSIDTDALARERGGRVVSLPPRALDRRRCWVRRRDEAPSDARDDAPLTAAPGDDDGLERKLRALAADVLRCAPEEIDPSAELMGLGFDSISFAALARGIGDVLAIELSPAVFFERRSLRALVEHLRATGRSSAPAEVVAATSPSEPIAVIGLSGLLPGARDLDDLFEHICARADLVSEVPAPRWRWQDHGSPEQPERARWGGFVDQVDCFDAEAFGITPAEAAQMDPQQRLVLEQSFRAIESAGMRPSALAGTRTGVWVGATTSDYRELVARDAEPAPHALAGTIHSILPNRLSFALDLRGPSVAVDTACSSSLVALLAAVDALRSGACELAIVGGVNAMLTPTHHVTASRAGMTSPRGRCRTFDASADGYARGEGVGVVLLKPLRRALADGDPIHGVVRGGTVNHGGRVGGLTVPNPVAQTSLLVEAYQRAGVDIADIGMIEAHGTGTRLGDPIEVRALRNAFEELGRTQRRPAPPATCALGSLKSNVGHLEAAAGIAGVLKALLCVSRGVVPGVALLEETNPHLELDGSAFYLPRETRAWPAPRDGSGRRMPRRAGVSSFGFGGVNAHVIVEEHVAAGDVLGATLGADCSVFPFAARTPELLREYLQAWLRFLERETDTSTARFAAIAYTLRVGREPHPVRTAVLATSLAELRARIAAQLEGGVGSGVLADEVAALPASSVQVPARADARDDEALARAWVGGALLDWSELYAAARPRRTSVPANPFARTRHWLTGDAAGPVRPLVEEWLATELVERAATPTATHRPAGVRRVVLVRGDQRERAASAFVGPATDRRTSILVVGAGGDVREDDDASVRALPARLGEIDEIIDLVDLGASAAPRPWRGRVTLLQAIVREHRARGLRILHARDADPVSARSAATVAAFVRACAAEHGTILARALELDDASIGSALRSIIDEELACDEGVVDVARRAGRRFVPQLASAALDASVPTLAERVRADATYLITGGTRGLGARIAEHLVTLGARRLVLVGRTSLPEDRAALSALAARDAAVRAVLDRAQALEDRGARVVLGGGVLSGAGTTRALLNRARRELGPITGVIHCAGLVGDGDPAFASKDVDAIARVLEPKLDATEVLAAELAHDPIEFSVLFSSVSALCPALSAGVSDYAAANAALDAFARARHAAGDRSVISVQWPSWSESGMGEVKSARYRELGWRGLPDARAMRFFDALRPGGMPPVVCAAYADATRFDRARVLGIKPRTNVARPHEAPEDTIADGANVQWLRRVIASELGLRAERIDPRSNFADLGIDSILLAQLIKRLDRELGAQLDPALPIEQPSVEALAAELARRGLGPATAPRAADPPMPHDSSAMTVTTEGASAAGIPASRYAIVGIAARFPQSADKDAFFSNLLAGRDCVTEVPRTRWDAARLYAPEPSPGRSISRWGGYVDGIEELDPTLLGLSGEDAAHVDPLVRLFVEASLRALEDAGLAPEQVAGRRVGVFCGARTAGYQSRIETPRRFSVVATGQNFIAAHVSQLFDLRGPSLVVDSACSSSLLAVHLACRSLDAGDCELAIAGGVEVLLDEHAYLMLSSAGTLSPSGRCRTFDERADGFVPGEGAGAVLLQPLERALAEGAPIYAVIEGSAVNNDGRTMGVTTPSPSAQEALLRATLADVGVDARTIGYVEAHGTGTLIGDPIELKSLTEVFRDHTDERGFCAIGSVKSNIGHLLSAAGIAGLVKVALALHRGVIPPTIHCEQPNPRFAFERSPFFVAREACVFPVIAGARRAAISSFGFGGTNVHAILRDVDARWPRAAAVRSPLPPRALSRERRWLEKLAPSVVPPRPAEPRPTPPRTAERVHGVFRVRDVDLG